MYVCDFLNKFALSKLLTLTVLAAAAQRADHCQLNATLSLNSHTKRTRRSNLAVKRLYTFIAFVLLNCRDAICRNKSTHLCVKWKT